MNFIIALTHNCQLRCDYCYAGEKQPKSITQATIQKAMDLLFTLPMNKLEFALFGGEPLMEWTLFQWATQQIETQTQQRGIELVKTVTTNAILLTPQKVAWLKEHRFYVVISLDGNEVMHNTHRRYANGQGSFGATLEGLHRLQQHYHAGEYAVVSVVTPDNIHHLNNAIKYLHKEQQINTFHLPPNYYAQWEEDESHLMHYRQIYHALGDYLIQEYRQGNPLNIDIIDDKIKTQIVGGCAVCSFGEQKIAIAPSGNIYPCERLIGEDTGELSIGSVYEGFDTAKRHQLITQRGNINEECQTCPIKHRCMNSCGCTNYTLTGHINTTSGVICFFQTLFVEVADRVASTLYQERNAHFIQKFYGENR